MRKYYIRKLVTHEAHARPRAAFDRVRSDVSVAWFPRFSSCRHRRRRFPKAHRNVYSRLILRAHQLPVTSYYYVNLGPVFRRRMLRASPSSSCSSSDLICFDPPDPYPPPPLSSKNPRDRSRPFGPHDSPDLALEKHPRSARGVLLVNRRRLLPSPPLALYDFLVPHDVLFLVPR